MKKLFFTITGCSYRYGLTFFKPNMTVTLVKEPDNKYDREAIRVELEGLGTVGYVANSPRTVRGTSMSAGRLYDKIGSVTSAVVDYVLSDSVICSVPIESESRSDGSGNSTEALPPEQDHPFRFSDTQDLDLYSQETSEYLFPTKEERNSIETILEKTVRLDGNERAINLREIDSASEETDELPRIPAEMAGTDNAAYRTAPETANPDMEIETSGEVPLSPEKTAEKEETAFPANGTISEPDPAEQEPAAGETAEKEEASASSFMNTITGQQERTAPAAFNADAAAETTSHDRPLSAEEIASALTAALSGLAVDDSASAGENPDAEYIYGNRSAEMTAEQLGAMLSEELGGMTAENMQAILSGSSEISPADFISALTGSTDAHDQAEPVLSVTETETAAEDSSTVSPSGDTVDSEWEEETSHVPGLNFNTVRFPEEEDGYTVPSRTVPESEPDPLPQDSTGPSAEESAAELAAEPEESPTAPATEPDPAESASIPEAAGLTTDLPPETAAPVPSADIAVDMTAQEEEEDDGVSQPFIFDESELDENLAKLHLENIDATYLSDSFLENLRKTLRENS